MKLMAIGDVFINEKIMEEALKSKFGNDCEVLLFHFGYDDKQYMRGIVKKIEEFKSVGIPDGIFEVIEDVDIIMTHLCPVTSDMINRGKKLKYILSNRGGIENIDIESANKNNIVVINNPEHNENAVDDYTIELILNETRNITRSDEALRNQIWQEDYPNSSDIKELRDLTIGIIGYGTIGKLVANKLNALNCKILIYDYNNISKLYNEYEFTDLKKLLKSADIITLHARTNKQILNRKMLSYLKEDAYVINTARSNLIDNQELFNLLKNGKILGAALDVFDIEPLEKENEFLKLNNVTLTNHRAGDTLDSYIKSPLMLVEKLKKYIEL